MSDPRTSHKTGLHEPDALNARRMLGWGCGVILLVGFALAIMAGLLALLQSSGDESRLDRRLATEPSAPLGATSASPMADQLAQSRAEQRRRLDEYGWVDRPERVVHIPIDRAMRLLLERKFPSRETSTNPNESQ